MYVEPSEADLAAITLRKFQAGQRLAALSAKARADKLVLQEEELSTLLALKTTGEKGRKTDYEKRLKAAGFETELEFEAYLAKVGLGVRKGRAKAFGDEIIVEEKVGPSFPPPSRLFPPPFMCKVEILTGRLGTSVISSSRCTRFSTGRNFAQGET